MESLSRYPSVAPHILRLAANRDRAKSASAPLKIAYVFDRRSDYLALGFSKEQCEELDSDHTIDCVAVSLRNLGEVELVGSFPSLVSRLAAGAHKQWDLVFNYAKGFAGREAQTPSLLEAFRVSFTLSGSAAQTLCLDRCRTKVHVLRLTSEVGS
jgi:D-alanine-D-alanine ligase-like ATP-grasp enzyme